MLLLQICFIRDNVGARRSWVIHHFTRTERKATSLGQWLNQTERSNRLLVPLYLCIMLVTANHRHAKLLHFSSCLEAKVCWTGLRKWYQKVVEMIRDIFALVVGDWKQKKRSILYFWWQFSWVTKVAPSTSGPYMRWGNKIGCGSFSWLLPNTKLISPKTTISKLLSHFFQSALGQWESCIIHRFINSEGPIS